MNGIPVKRIIEALERADMLVGRTGTLPSEVGGMSEDSRSVTPGSLFVAVMGHDRDGHEFLQSAAERGASMAIVEDPSRSPLPSLVVQDGRVAAAVAAAAAFGDPARSLSLLAVTGTNGKTTTVGILRHLLDQPSAPSASIGTLGSLVGSSGVPTAAGSGLTTPGPVELQRILRAFVDRGVHTVAMEVSSHSLDQRRVEAVRFGVAVFTNFTRDHLDYHGTMESYFAAKAQLLARLAPDGVAVINADDVAWRGLPAVGRKVTFSSEGADADVRAEAVRYASRGSEWQLVVAGERHDVRLPLIGSFNVANSLAAAAAAWSSGIAPSVIADRLVSSPQVAGRLELLSEAPTVLRDYAHTPDALSRALDAVRPFAPAGIIVVFGCGGDRDRGKRPLMGAVAERGADRVIITSDNPRTEDPERILDDIAAGMTGRACERIEDRHAAIARALELAREGGELVLLAGKGHETYQIRGTTMHPFDEGAIVRAQLGGVA